MASAPMVGEGMLALATWDGGGAGGQEKLLRALSAWRWSREEADIRGRAKSISVVTRIVVL